MKSWEGKPISRFVALNGQPSEVTKMKSGLSEYKFLLLKVDATCVQYWIVDDAGIMKQFHYDGRCRPI